MTDPQLGVPAAPQPRRRPIEGRRVAMGVGIAIAAHLLTLVPMLFGLADPNFGARAVFIFLIAQVLVALTLIVVGIVRIVRQDGGVGVGLLIGWAVGVLVSFGGCVALLRAGAAG